MKLQPRRTLAVALVCALATAAVATTAPTAQADTGWKVLVDVGGRSPVATVAGVPMTLTASGSGATCAGRHILWAWNSTTMRWHVQASTTDCQVQSRLSPGLRPGLYRFAVTTGATPTAATPVRALRVNPAAVTLSVPGSVAAGAAPQVTLSAGKEAAGTVAEVRALYQGTWRVIARTPLNASGQLVTTLNLGRGASGRVWLEGHVVIAPGVTTRSAATPVDRAAVFRATTRPATAADLGVTYRAGCPVGPSQLTYISLNHWGYDGQVKQGMIVVRSSHAASTVTAFKYAFERKFPIKTMRNPSVWGGDDYKMMAAGNTSGFNCRQVTGNPYNTSPHSYGIAIDVNTYENPYRTPAGVWLPNATYATYRPASVPGLLTSSSSLTVALKGQGFDWYSGWDWQHFQR